jgi:predicted dehydrogenase
MGSEVLRFGVIGCGYWGPNVIRNLSNLADVTVVAVADRDEERLESAGRRNPAIETMTDARTLLARDDLDAVAIVTPLETHFDFAKVALESGKHVFIEKPIAATVEEAQELIDVADRAGRVLMVDHTFVYTGAVRTIRELIEGGDLGDLYYFDSVRVNLGQFRDDVNVLWDLGPHDLSIMLNVLPARPVAVSAIGSSPVSTEEWGKESLAYVSVWLEGGMLAHLHLNWLSPVKIRRTLIGGSRRMVVYDALDPDNQIKVFDKGVDVSSNEAVRRALVDYRTGDMVAPKVDQTEALEVGCRHFIECIRQGRTPDTGGKSGLQVVRLLEAAQRSMSEMGRVVDLS